MKQDHGLQRCEFRQISRCVGQSVLRCENLPPAFQKSGGLVLLQHTQCLGLLKNDNDMASYMVICHR